TPAVAPNLVDSAPDPSPEQAAEERAGYVAALVEQIQAVRYHVLTRVFEKLEAKSAERINMMSDILFWLSLAGLLLLLLPLFLRKHYPGRTIELFKYSALAAVT